MHVVCSPWSANPREECDAERRTRRRRSGYRLLVGEVAGRVWVTCIPRRRERPAQLFANHDGTRRAPRSDGYLRVRVGVGPEVAWRGHASRRDQRSRIHEARRSRADGAATFGDVSRDRRGTWGWGWLYARVGDVVGRAGMVETHFECKIPTGQNVSQIVA